MRDFKETPAGYRLLIVHPTPWVYKSDYLGGSKSAIVDANGKAVITEGQVSNVLYDTIWTMYFDFLRDDEEG
jgi:hypothetical protein